MTHAGGTYLMELACSPMSSLSAEMEKQMGPGSAVRASIWNGHKLGTVQGDKAARDTRDYHNPRHLWIASRCGPLSPITLGLNGGSKNPVLVEKTRKRRIQAIREYKGAVQVAYDQSAAGGHVHWEWPIGCEGWAHNMVRSMVDDLDMIVVKVTGCAFGAKNRDGETIKKEWLIATTSPRVAARLESECPGGHVHVPLESSRMTAQSAYYPEEMVRRAVGAMIKDEAGDYVQFVKDAASYVMEGASEPNNKDEQPPDEVTSKEEREKIHRWLTSVHRGCGHASRAAMDAALRRQGAPKKVIAACRHFVCDACVESFRQQPSVPAVSLESIPAKWKHVQADQFEWHHPHTKEKFKGSLIIDECCKVRVAKWLFKLEGPQARKMAKWPDLKAFYEERWMPYFGKPQRFKVDPEGAWMDKEAALYFDKDSIYQEVIPGQAHWHISLAEEAIRATKATMDALVSENPTMSGDEALARAVAAGNSREDVRGHSPLQHALGRAPDIDGHFFEPDFDELPYVDAQRVDKQYGQDYARMFQAEQAYLKQVYQRRISRALNTKNKTLQSVAPGMFVRYYRKEKGETKGSYKGLARVLATETTRTVGYDGSLPATGSQVHPGHPSSVVWLIRGGRLMKADLTQVRAASAREVTYAEMMEKSRVATPWTIVHAMKDSLPGQYIDITGVDPTEQEEDEASWERVMRPPIKKPRIEEQPQVQDRASGAQRRPRPTEDASVAEVKQFVEELRQRTAQERRGLSEKSNETASCFWARQSTALEIAVELPAHRGGMKGAIRDMTAYMANQIKKGRREVSERSMTDMEREKFAGAKQAEVNNYIVSAVLETLPPDVTPPPEQVMRMRWVLEYKINEHTGDKKPKARLVVLGYMDPQYEHRPTTAPTMTKTSRHLVLQLTAWLGMDAHKADVTGAFTQNRPTQRDDMWVLPVPELAKAMGLPEKTAAKLRKAVYGLVEAAIEWYLTVSEVMAEQGWTRMKMDPCVWVLYGDNHGHCSSKSREALAQHFAGQQVESEILASRRDLDIIGVAGSHVDDFLYGGRSEDARWVEAKRRLEERFQWKEWEHGVFYQTGVKIRQQLDKSFLMDQAEYVKGIEKIYVNPSRKAMKESMTTESEKTQLRAVLGAIGWRSEQTGPTHSADVSWQLSNVPQSTVKSIDDANKLVDRVREQADKGVTIHSHKGSDVLVPVVWADSAEGNRPDGSSTKGLVMSMAPLEIFGGIECDVTMVNWKAGKIDRMCRSSTAAETRATVDGEDELYGLKLQWLELLGNKVNWKKPDLLLRGLPGVCVTDSKGLYDKLRTVVFSPKGKEKRVDIEAMTMKDESARAGNTLLWVHGDAQLANSLTKGHEPGQLRLFYSCGARWKLVYDEKFRSGRRRKAEGVAPLDGPPVVAGGRFHERSGLQDRNYEELTEDEEED